MKERIQTKNEITALLQKREMEMLTEIKHILNRNNIPFYLGFGSLLGCIRHKGFIPWDDDIDIHIDGKYYKQLKQVFCEQDTGTLILEDGLNTDGYPFCFPKIVDKKTLLVEKEIEHLNYRCGVYIDVFLVFGVPDNAVLRFFSKWCRYFKYAVLKAKYQSRGFLHLVSKLFSARAINKSLYKTYSSGINGKKACCEPTTFDNKIYMSSSFFCGCIEKEFGDQQMPVPLDYDLYLRHFYGDYLELPPLEKRISNHNISKLYIDGEKII